MAVGHRVYVKNTFLDLEDGPRLHVLERARSEPNPGPIDKDSEDSEEETGAEAGDSITGGPTAPEFGDLGDVAAPEMPDLYRTTTCDGYEPTHMWSWVNEGGDPNALGSVGLAPAPAPPQPADLAPPVAGYTAMQTAPTAPMPGGFPTAAIGGGMGTGVGVVMVPMPMMVPATNRQQEMQAVQVDRFTRWPEPNAPTGPAAAPAAPAPELARTDTPGAPPPGAPSLPEGADTTDLDVRRISDVPRAPVLERAFSVTSQVYRVRWTVDARKLKSSDREAVSPLFELSFTQAVQFKMVIRPKTVHELRGGASFKKAKGKGSVEMRCLERVSSTVNPVVTFRIAVGSGHGNGEPARGPVKHDFSDRAICGLPDDIKEWDFAKHVDPETQTFVVCLEILSGAAAAAAIPLS